MMGGAMSRSDAGRLAVADQRRAEHVETLVTPRIDWRACSRVVLIATAVALVSATCVIAYARLLSMEGISASTLCLLAVLLAATLSSIAGFAFSAVCGVMLLQIMSDPVKIVEVMIVCSIAIQSVSVAVLWRHIDWRSLLKFLAGGVIGLPMGVWLLLHVGQFWFKEAIGGLLIAYAALRLLQRPCVVRSHSSLADAGVGFLGGITGGLAGFPGAAVTIWCGMRGWDKQRQRGVYQPFILFMQILALLLIGLMRSIPHGAGLDLGPAMFVPPALLGTWLGLAMFRRLSDQGFGLAVNLLLFASGVGLLV
jgi:uncharacterized protein